MPVPETLARLGLTLAIAFAGAEFFVWLGLPLPYMLGPMTVAMLVSMFTPIKLIEVKVLNMPGRSVIGLAIGSAFVPEIAGRLHAFLPSLIMLVTFLSLCAIISFYAQRRWLKIDPTTSFFAALPGGAASMILIGRSFGADGTIVGLLHGVRLFVLVAIVPNIVLWIDSNAGFTAHVPPPVAFAAVETWIDYAILGAAGLAAARIGRLIRMPSPELLGAMIVSALLYSTDIVHAHLPNMLVNVAQLLIGVTLGNGFKREDRARVVRMGGFNAVVMTVLIALSGVLAVILHSLTGVPYSLILLAFAPGGLTEMSVMAYTMGLPVEFVAVHHVTRVMLVPFAAPVFYRLLRPWFQRMS
jgi:membrane AbrB-like protein